MTERMSELDKAVQQRDRLGRALEACRTELSRLRRDGEMTTAEESATITLTGIAIEVTDSPPKSPLTDGRRIEWRDQRGELVFAALLARPEILDQGV